MKGKEQSQGWAGELASPRNEIALGAEVALGPPPRSHAPNSPQRAGYTRSLYATTAMTIMLFFLATHPHRGSKILYKPLFFVVLLLRILIKLSLPSPPRSNIDCLDFGLDALQ